MVGEIFRLKAFVGASTQRYFYLFFLASHLNRVSRAAVISLLFLSLEIFEFWS